MLECTFLFRILFIVQLDKWLILPGKLYKFIMYNINVKSVIQNGKFFVPILLPTETKHHNETFRLFFASI